MSRPNRWFLYGPFIFAGLVLTGWYFLWRAGAETMRSSLSEFAESAAADRVSVSYGALKTKGFPFFLRGAVEDFAVSDSRRLYQCGRLFIDALPYALDRLIFSCGGAQSVIVKSETWTITAKDARASIERDKARGWMIKAETGSLTAQSGAGRFAVAAAVLNAGPSLERPAGVDITARIAHADTTTRDGAVVAIEQMDAAVSISEKDLSGQRKIAFHGIETTLNQARFSAQGALVVADNGALSGRLDAIIEKPAGLAQALAAAHLLDGDEARATEAGLAMLAIASGGSIAAPIDFDEGEIRLGGIRLARIKPAAQP